jgi:hypothetical protein
MSLSFLMVIETMRARCTAILACGQCPGVWVGWVSRLFIWVRRELLARPSSELVVLCGCKGLL